MSQVPLYRVQGGARVGADRDPRGGQVDPDKLVVNEQLSHFRVQGII